MSNDLEQQLLDISRHAFRDEAECVRDLLPHTEVFRARADAIFARAKTYVEEIREGDFSSGVESFLHQYGLETREGVAIMCLAEALLRVPDAATADALIHDKFRDTEWEKHLQQDGSLFVNASTWGLMLTGGVVQMGDLPTYSVKGLFGKLVNRLGEPVIRTALKKAMEVLGGQFVLGTDIKSALKRAKKRQQEGYLFSYDMLGEGARTAEQAEHFYQAYHNAITVIGESDTENAPIHRRPSISVKLSALHPRYELVQRDRVMNELLPKVKELLHHARKYNMVVSLDAEEATRLDIQLELFASLLADPELKGYDGIGFVLQAYQKRALPVLELLTELAHTHGHRIPIRLVKGAYWDAEIKKAQVDGLPGYPVFTRKSHTDVSYLACAAKILANSKAFYPQFATHNALTVASILEISGDKEFEFQRLYGMGESFYNSQVKQRPVRIYAPVGSHKELLPYLIRRLLENNANTSFVNLVVDENEPIGKLLRNPLERVVETKGEPREDIPLPRDIYPNRKNSTGVDFGNRAMLKQLTDDRLQLMESLSTVNRQPSICIEDATQAFPAWNAKSFSDRAELLEDAAKLYEKHAEELIRICVNEAHKTLPDSVAEIREAVDFLRYYASEARKLDAGEVMSSPTGESNTLGYIGKGVFAAISPWNFPLAIFTGQVAAALVTGNCVIAKPAEQTPCIACKAVELLHEAGIPKHALHLVTGKGSEVGPILTGDKRICGVVFTGSTETAQSINRSLSQREGVELPTLIAETGGQNCMIVDSTALLEAAADDILLSAFGSAGQRCSAARVLFVQEDIADNLLELLKGGLKERTLGDPADLATDIPPVIDAKAQAELMRYIERMEKESYPKFSVIPAKAGIHVAAEQRIYGAKALPLRDNMDPHLRGDDDLCYVAPSVFEIPNISVLKREVFGPVLHVVRWKDLDEVIEQVNSTGYGLTFGIHSRIESRYLELSRCIHAGNIYVNRSMIGAVVGVQPFGGMGLSGTGPKAGGPNYLKRFVHEKTLTVNTTAIGGNLGLLV